MKKICTVSLAAFFLTIPLLAQENDEQITIDITREVDGKTEKFNKTYASKEEMEADEELQAFSEDLAQMNHVTVNPGGNQIVKIHKTDSSSSYAFDFDTEVKKVVKKMNGYDRENNDSLAVKLQKQIYKLEEAMAKLGVDIKEEIEILEDMDWDEIKDRHKIMIIDKEVEEDEMMTEYEGTAKTVTISVVDGSELGKMAKVNSKELLDLEALDYYPNPSQGRFRLKFEVSDEEGPLNIKVYNKEDQEVFVRYFPRYSGTYSELIDLRGQDPGTYLLEISHGKKRLVRKMVVQ
ncbi:MAG: T9SS type A sorting domain-containing protein [Cyclobacteriaceae bacterium]